MATKRPTKGGASGGFDPILAQMCAAFGQGTGGYRIHRDALATLIERYTPILPELQKTWDEGGVQTLERLRAVGRTAAHLATVAGHTAIDSAHVTKAARMVEKTSNTPICPSP